MNFPFDPIQAAIFARLNGTISATVHDEPEDDQAMPYAIVGDAILDLSESRAKTHDIVTVTATVHVYSGAKGYSEVNGILAEILTAMGASRIDLSADSLAVIDQKVGTVEVFRESNGVEIVRHGIARFDLDIMES